MPPEATGPAPAPAPTPAPRVDLAADGGDVLRRTAAFRLSFARRQAVVVREVPGGVAVLDPRFPASHEHNQLLWGADGPGAGLPGAAQLVRLAGVALGHLAYRRITVLDDGLGLSCAPVLTAAGYRHSAQLVMACPTAGARLPEGPAREVPWEELRPAVAGQSRRWLPAAGEEVVRQLVARREARRGGADRVRFLAVRGAGGEVVAWADLYTDTAGRLAQVEEVVTAEGHRGLGHGDTLLATARALSADAGLLFLVAEAGDWPRTWYARRGLRALGRTHVFTRS